MNSIRLKLADCNGEKYEISLNDNIPQLVLSDEVVSKFCEQYNIGTLKSVSLTLGVYNMAVNIENYTLTDVISIDSFYDIKSCISIFQTKGTNIHIVGQSIDHLQADSKKILIAECTVEKFEIGMFEQHSRLGNKDITDIFRADSLVLRDSTIKNLDIYAEYKTINMQGCTVDEFNNYGNLFKEYDSNVECLHLWQNTNVRRLLLSNAIKKLTFEDSTVGRLLARPNLLINNLEIKDSIIENFYGFTPDSFENLVYESWDWIGKSASNARDLQLKTEANYQTAKSVYDTQSKKDKIVSDIFDFCAGYGYKPMRIVRATGIIAIFNAMVFTLIDIVEILNTRASIPLNVHMILKGLYTLWNNFLLAIASFAGQISFSIKDGLPFWLSVIEYLLGVILFAMFVNALYVRYKE